MHETNVGVVEEEEESDIRAIGDAKNNERAGVKTELCRMSKGGEK